MLFQSLISAQILDASSQLTRDKNQRSESSSCADSFIKKEAGDDDADNKGEISKSITRKRGRPKRSELSHLKLDPAEQRRRERLAQRMRKYRKHVKRTETEQEAVERRKKQAENMRKYRASLRLNRSSEDSKSSAPKTVKVEKLESEMTADERRRMHARKRMKRYFAKKLANETPDEAAKRRQIMAEKMRDYRRRKKFNESSDADSKSSKSVRVKREKSSEDDLMTPEKLAKIEKTKRMNSDKMKRYWAKKLQKETEEEKLERRKRMAEYTREYRLKKKLEQGPVERPPRKEPPAYSPKYLQIKKIRDTKLANETEEQAAERKRIGAERMREYRARKKMTEKFPEFCSFQDRRYKKNKHKSRSLDPTKLAAGIAGSSGSAPSQQRIVYIKASSQQRLLTLCE